MNFYSFETEDAVKYGVNEAVIIHVLKFWITKNHFNAKHQHDGHTWTYNSIEAFTKQFPFWTTYQVHHTLKKLVATGVIIKGNYNQTPYDRTLWYAMTDESFLDISSKSILKKDEIHLGDFPNGKVKNDKPIPVYIPLPNPGIKPKEPPTPKWGKEKIFPESFEDFWKSYPSTGRQRSGKDKAMKEWSKLDPDEQDSLPYSLEAWKLSQKWTASDGQFIDGVDKWLRNGMWREIPEAGPYQYDPAKIQPFQGWTQPSYD